MKTVFVIPVYNVAPYLDRCVESVLSQTLQDFEIVLVDDGSTDGSGQSCDEWASRDIRIRVLHRQNGGLGAARNTGIEDVLSRKHDGWITFLDSDDWLDHHYLERMKQAAESANAQIAVCRYWRPERFETSAPPASPEKHDKTLSPDGFFSWCSEHGTDGLFIGNMACAKLYDLHLWQSVRFPDDGKAHEDMFTTYKTLFATEKIALVDEPLYAYFVNPASITGGGYKWSPPRINAVLAGREQLRFLAERAAESTFVTCLGWHFGRILWNLENMDQSKDNRIFRQRLFDMLREDWNLHGRFLNPDNCQTYWSVRKTLHPLRAACCDSFRRLARDVRRNGVGKCCSKLAMKSRRLFSRG